MKIEKIKPIPKYLLERIRKADRRDPGSGTGHTRFYAYLTKNDGSFTDGNLERIGLSPNSPALRACGKGEPKRTGNRVEVNGMYYELKANE